MPTINSTDPQDQKAQEAVTKANQDLNDQGDIAADDAGHGFGGGRTAAGEAHAGLIGRMR